MMMMMTCTPTVTVYFLVVPHAGAIKLLITDYKLRAVSVFVSIVLEACCNYFQKF